MNDEKICRLVMELLEAIDDFTAETEMTVGDVMGALFSVLVASAQSSPNYDPAQLVTQMDTMIREAVAEDRLQ